MDSDCIHYIWTGIGTYVFYITWYEHFRNPNANVNYSLAWYGEAAMKEYKTSICCLLAVAISDDCATVTLIVSRWSHEYQVDRPAVAMIARLSCWSSDCHVDRTTITLIAQLSCWSRDCHVDRATVALIVQLSRWSRDCHIDRATVMLIV